MQGGARAQTNALWGLFQGRLDGNVTSVAGIGCTGPRSTIFRHYCCCRLILPDNRNHFAAEFHIFLQVDGGDALYRSARPLRQHAQNCRKVTEAVSYAHATTWSLGRYRKTSGLVKHADIGTQEPISLHHGHCTVPMERFLLPVSGTLAANLVLCPFARQDRKESQGMIRSTQVGTIRFRMYGLGYDSLMGDARTMHRVAGQGQKQKQSVVVATSTSVLFDSQASSTAVWSEGRDGGHAHDMFPSASKIP